MQTQWAKANIRSETKNTPLRSQGGQLFLLSEGSDLNGGTFKPIRKLRLRSVAGVHWIMIKAFLEEGCKA